MYSACRAGGITPAAIMAVNGKEQGPDFAFNITGFMAVLTKIP